MPIKQENKKLYPPYWRQLSEYVRHERAQNKCEFCGVQNGTTVLRFKFSGRDMYLTETMKLHDSNTGEILDLESVSDGDEYRSVKIVLTVAHLDHDPTNNRLTNLKALCQRCHNRYDVEHRKETREKSKNDLTLF